MTPIPSGWRDVLDAEVHQPYFQRLQEFVDKERKHRVVYPPGPDVFNALAYTPPEKVKAVLLGQDPYHDDGQAHGLCFSVRPGVRPPPSLVNVFKELNRDSGCKIPNNGCLIPWAERGVLLLNAVLTVRAHEPNSHKGQGWETFTDAILRHVSATSETVVFLLWGTHAQKKEGLIDASRHVVFKAAHPSPLSVKKFFGCRPFSSANRALMEAGRTPIDWQIPDLPADGF
jgi:uracil-DNA glycosylase